ncbi:MAG: AbrB/MazE/SpoVT family DNA-binding domain-containing protein [Acidimicrobiales bacterium]
MGTKHLRDRLHLGQGGPVDIDERDGTIEIRPASSRIVIAESPEGPIAVPEGPVPPLTDANVRETVDHLRR